MNGEVYQAARLVTSFKTGKSFERKDYEKEIHFSFLPKGLIAKSEHWVSDPQKWFTALTETGITDLYLIMKTKTSAKERKTFGFINTQPVIIASKYRNNKYSYWKPQWSYNAAINGWIVEYSERPWRTHPKETPFFINNSDNFKNSLIRISDFSRRMGIEYYEKLFNSSVAVLDGKVPSKEYRYVEISELPEINKRLFRAASLADVFGGMGTWNDNPCAAAKEKGLLEEYNDLSDELLKQIRIAVMFAVNW